LRLADTSPFTRFTMSLDFKNLLGASESSGIGQQAAQSAMGIDGGCFPSLTFKQRIIGFGCCFTLGMVITFLSTLSLMNPVQFGVCLAAVATKTGARGALCVHASA
jgi:hypothetical protein